MWQGRAHERARADEIRFERSVEEIWDETGTASLDRNPERYPAGLLRLRRQSREDRAVLRDDCDSRGGWDGSNRKLRLEDTRRNRAASLTTTKARGEQPRGLAPRAIACEARRMRVVSRWPVLVMLSARLRRSCARMRGFHCMYGQRNRDGSASRDRVGARQEAGRHEGSNRDHEYRQTQAQHPRFLSKRQSVVKTRRWGFFDRSLRGLVTLLLRARARQPEPDRRLLVAEHRPGYRRSVPRAASAGSRRSIHRCR